ncbi:hypothetical protein BBJ28_00000857 [Nothophytophthora sp. Chile5]|nr:hypothetical protein BBJ28_00000857 [Nothophytophthora sp. Chile5]
MGTGCCQHLGTIGDASQLVLHFKDDDQPQAAVEMGGNFQPIDVYLKQITLELGGVDKHARTLLQAILHRLDGERKGSDVTAEPGVGAIVSGLPGVGKTVLAKAICKSLGVQTIFLNAADIFQTYVGQSEAQLVKIFERAMLQSPSILLIDGIEAIAGARRGLADSQSALEIGVLGALLASLEKIKASSHRVFVLGTTTRLGDMDAAVLSNGRLDQVVNIEPPTQRERLEILRVMTRTWQADELNDAFLNQLSETTGGFVGADLLSLCQKALQCFLNEAAANKKSDSVVRPHHFEKALAVTYPSVLQTHHVSQKKQQPESTSIQRSAVGGSGGLFAGVYGMQDAIQSLQVSLIEPLQDCSRFLAFGTTPPKGVLLTGPPGSGKTHLAHAIADVVRRHGLASFVSVQCSDLLTKIVGDTEKALRELFATARNAAPCVLYFDQIEGIAPLRGFDTSTEQTFDRMLSMLLVEMDGFNTSRAKLERSLASDEARIAFLKQHVVILASTTNKELLDPAILRPGRFDVHINVEFPDEDARCAIILDALSKIPVAYSADLALDSREALARYMAQRTGGLSAGDVSTILREAAMACMRDDLSAVSVAIKYVTQALDAATSATPSSNMADGMVLASNRNAGNSGMRFKRNHGTTRRSATDTPRASRNRYKANPPDFYLLGEQYPAFKQ